MGIEPLFRWFGAYPVWVQAAVLSLLGAIAVLLLFFQGGNRSGGKPTLEAAPGRAQRQDFAWPEVRRKLDSLISRLEVVERHGESYRGETNELAARAESVISEIRPTIAEEIRRLSHATNYTQDLAAGIRIQLLKVRDSLDTGGLQREGGSTTTR